MMQMTPDAKFWNWFVRHEAELLDFETNKERIFDAVGAELQEVNPNLTFEFGPKAARREFIISAGGIKSVFPAVVSLCNAAPSLDRWQIIAFRPRRYSPNIVEFRGKSVRPGDVQFSLLDNGKTAGLYLFLPNFRDDDVGLKQIGYLLLDDSLGEYDVESRLGLIKMLSPDTRTNEERYPLAELPSRFDELVSRLEGRSGGPS